MFSLQAKYLAQIIVTGVSIVSRAFSRALRQEILASQQAAKARQNAKDGSRSAAQNAISGMTLQVSDQLHWGGGNLIICVILICDT